MPDALRPQDWTAALVPTAAALLCQASCDNAAAGLAVAHTGLHTAFASADNGLRVLGDYLRAHATVLRGEDAQQPWSAAQPYMRHAVQQLWQDLPHQLSLALQQQQLT